MENSVLGPKAFQKACLPGMNQNGLGGIIMRKTGLLDELV